jgi:ribosome-associated toxin RatA of RatAB toxin-antitoxin module
MRVGRSIVVGESPETVFELVSDPTRYPEFFQGVTRWKPLSDHVGIGARYRVLMQVGSIEAGGIVAVREWQDPVTIRWDSESGIKQRGRWELEEDPAGTRLSLDIEYSLSGGPAGWLVERMTARIVGRHLWATLLAARRILEQERASPKLHV